MSKGMILISRHVLTVYDLITHPTNYANHTLCVNCSGDWKQKLLEIIDADQIPVAWGGTKTDPDGDIYCKSQVRTNRIWLRKNCGIYQNLHLRWNICFLFSARSEDFFSRIESWICFKLDTHHTNQKKLIRAFVSVFLNSVVY